MTPPPGKNLPRVAVVEDDKDQRDSIVDFLLLLGYRAWGVCRGEALYRRLLAEPVDVVVLDVGLPGEDGFSIARHLRTFSGVGVVMLTARGGLADRIAGLDSGADTYLVKPLDLRELAANIDAVARRLQAGPAQRGEDEACWRLDRESWRWSAPDGASLKLTAKEYLFVRCLADAWGDTVSKAVLAAQLGGEASACNYNRLDVMLSRLRRKGEESFGRAVPIKAVTSLGFALTARCLLI